nr:immunoglobulin heavy chain junction region [Mus musculus]
CSRTPLFDFW